MENQNIEQNTNNASLSPVSVMGAFVTDAGGTKTSDNYSWVIDYIWENHSNFYSLIRRFNIIREYEKNLNMTSEELLNKWKTNELINRSEPINNWLNLYLQTKDYIK